MIYISKQLQTPESFVEAMADITSFAELQGKPRERIIGLLLEEQGGLCVYCERAYMKVGGERVFTATIEHFLPQSIFPQLELSYFNLFVVCNTCNNAKSNHIIPPYIFDTRFKPFGLKKNDKGINPVYELKDGKCFIAVPMAKSYGDSPAHYSAYLLQNTFDLLRLNRYLPDDKDISDKGSLIHQRAAIWKELQYQFNGLSNQRLTEKYEALKEKSPPYPEFIGLLAFLFEKVMLKRNIHITEQPVT
ncbi:MAG: hypothetical protein IPM47_06985 [Sphingobacteriales bacterium]|nr:MAG: hypothetical protein IPM47_06985 [Sphingobacteriales bacterium]